MSIPATASDPAAVAYDEGRRVGLATGALALSVVSYVNLLGIEKSLLAIALAIVALQGAGSFHAALRRGRVALAFALIHAVTVVAVVAIFHEKLTQLFKQFVKLYHTLS